MISHCCFDLHVPEFQISQFFFSFVDVSNIAKFLAFFSPQNLETLNETVFYLRMNINPPLNCFMRHAHTQHISVYFKGESDVDQYN